MDCETVKALALAVLGSGVFNLLLTRVFTSIDKKKSKDDGTRTALRLIMKNLIQKLCFEYIERGWVYQDEMEDLIVLHTSYHNDLKGNGFLDIPMTKVKELEIRGRSTGG